MLTVLLIVLIVLLVLNFPAAGWVGYGPGPRNVIGVILFVILLVVLLRLLGVY